MQDAAVNVKWESALVCSRKLFLSLTAFASLLLVVLGIVLLKASLVPNRPQTLPQQRPANPLNVVLILLDALRADRVEAQRNGIPLMPYLTRWSADAVRFTHASAPATWTKPSMASIFTGLYVDAHQVYFGPDPNAQGQPVSDALPPSLETMAGYLKKAGYRTACVQTNGNLVPEFGFAQGFDRYPYYLDVPASEVTAHALELCQDLAEPFFFYVHYMDPHFPYTPPERYKQLLGWPPPLDENELKLVSDFTPYFWDYANYLIGARKAPSYPPLSPAAQEAVRTLYDGEVRYLDDELGKLLEVIHAKWPNTLYIILADHGEHFWDHGYVGHGLTLYEEEVHVPFLLKGPGLAPRSVDANVETINILPTVAQILGLTPNPAWQGRSLFSNKDNENRAVFCRTRGPWAACNTDLEMVGLCNLKAILDRRRNRVELYDLTADPLEKHDLALERPKDVEAMRALVEAHRGENERMRQQGAPLSVPLPPDVLEQLQRLGYYPENTAKPE